MSRLELKIFSLVVILLTVVVASCSERDFEEMTEESSIGWRNYWSPNLQKLEHVRLLYEQFKRNRQDMQTFNRLVQAGELLLSDSSLYQHPSDVTITYFLLAFACQKATRYDSAASYADRIITFHERAPYFLERDLGTAWAYHTKAISLRKAGKFAEAEKTLKQLIVRFPNDLSWGSELYRGESRGILTPTDRQRGGKENFAVIGVYLLGGLYATQNKLDEGIEYFRTLQREYTGSRIALEALMGEGYLHALKRNYRELEILKEKVEKERRNFPTDKTIDARLESWSRILQEVKKNYTQ
jgi:tetratricopeptide (TPR) repeat protein